ncbi:MAG: metallophosphoesterase family protein [Anaerolineales bacterium]|nr:metallophosphoesterase family protein [Anaerolineales bacterium]
MARWAVLSDIHGNLAALEAVVADLAGQGVDRVLNLGDHASGPLWPAETMDYLVQQDWLHIAGNHDRQLVRVDPAQHGASDRYAYEHLTPEHLNWLRRLPAHATPTPELLAFHGSPTSDLVYLLETVQAGRTRLATPAEIRARLGEASAPLMVCGHTHRQRAIVVDESTLIVNPGSIGLPAYSGDTPELHVVEAGSPHARYAVLDDASGQWAVALRLVAYDHHAAARQAARNDRADWESALRTGRMTL